MQPVKNHCMVHISFPQSSIQSLLVPHVTWFKKRFPWWHWRAIKSFHPGCNSRRWIKLQGKYKYKSTISRSVPLIIIFIILPLILLWRSYNTVLWHYLQVFLGDEDELIREIDTFGVKMKGTAVFTTKNVMQTQVEAVWRSESEFGKMFCLLSPAHKR